MRLLEATLRAYEADDPRAALHALGDALAAAEGCLAAFWIDGDGEVREAWPEGATAPPLPPEAVRGGAPRVLPPEHSGALVLPLRTGPLGSLLLVDGAREWDPGAEWDRLAAAFSETAQRAEDARRGEEERDTLRRRAEESEALHVLGLAANRTLDPDEVLDLVARFARTLLGAHYVTVSTSEEGHIRTAASVGLRSSHGSGDDPFARRVAEAAKPLVLQPDGEDHPRVADFPFHHAEGMRAGLGVPLSLFGETFGALVVGYRRPCELAARDTRLALTLAGHAAVAISNARLHRDLAERTLELEAAYQELRWSSEGKERFFASMSHELRTPLNAVLGYQSLVLEGVMGEVPTAMRSFLEKGQRATENLLRLVNDVLDLSKLEAGRMDLVVEPASAAEIVRDAVASVEPLGMQKGIDIALEIPPGLPPLATDADRIRQVVVNLLSNAVKFTDRGGITVTVGARPAEPGEGPVSVAGHDVVPGCWLEVRVRDTGPGIAPEDQERVFQEFEQVSGAAARRGTGLGLAISRRLARLLGGDLQVESAPGAGATFILRLPVETGAGTSVA